MGPVYCTPGLRVSQGVQLSSPYLLSPPPVDGDSYRRGKIGPPVLESARKNKQEIMYGVVK